MIGANFFPEYLSHKDYIKYLYVQCFPLVMIFTEIIYVLSHKNDLTFVIRVLRNVNMSGNISAFIWGMKKLSVL